MSFLKHLSEDSHKRLPKCAHEFTTFRMLEINTASEALVGFMLIMMYVYVLS